MRRILVDEARRRGSGKRGGAIRRVDLESGVAVAVDGPQDGSGASADDLLALDEAMAAFEAHDPNRARLVKLRYFAGLTLPEAAEAMGISLATAKRHWVYARAWIYGMLADEDAPPRE